MSEEKPALKNPMKIGPLIGIFFMFCLANGCYSNHIKDHKQNINIPLLQEMIADQTTTVAYINPSVKEITVEVMHIPVKYYEVTYKYHVPGRSDYNGKATLSEPPAKAEMTVYYSKTRPSYSVFEPEKELKKVKSESTSNSNLYWSIGWLVLAFGSLALYIAEARTYYKAKKAIRDAEEEAYQRATNY